MGNAYRSPPKFSPAVGQSVLWMDANGDIKMKINVGGTVKTATLADFSSL